MPLRDLACFPSCATLTTSPAGAKQDFNVIPLMKPPDIDLQKTSQTFIIAPIY